MAVWKVKELTKFFDENNTPVIFKKDTNLTVFDSKFKGTITGWRSHYWKVGENNSAERYWILDDHIKNFCDYLRP